MSDNREISKYFDGKFRFVLNWFLFCSKISCRFEPPFIE